LCFFASFCISSSFIDKKKKTTTTTRRQQTPRLNTRRKMKRSSDTVEDLETQQQPPQQKKQEGSREANAQTKDSSAFRTDIEGLRGFAVLLVLLFHARIPFVPGGFVGVDVFFVISGFVITMMLIREQLETHSICFLQFYYRRFRRLLPNSVLCMIITVAVGFLLMDPISNIKLLEDVGYISIYYINIHYSQLSNYFLEQEHPSPLIHYWSLAVEEQFYFVWPLIFNFSMSLQKRWLQLLLPVFLFLFSLIYCQQVSTTADSSFAYFVLTSRGWQMLAGALLAFVQPEINNINGKYRSPISICGLLLVLYSALRFDSTMVYPGLPALIPTLGTVMMLMGDSSLPLSCLLSNAPLRWFGVKSYAIYLLHWPAIVYTTLYFSPPYQYVPTLFSCFWGVVLCIPIAMLLNVFVETPIRTAKWKRITPKKGVAIGVAIGFLCFGASVLLSCYFSTTLYNQTASNRLVHIHCVRVPFVLIEFLVNFWHFCLLISPRALVP